MDDLFSGPGSVRWPTERRSLVLTIVLLPISIAVVGFFLRHALDTAEIAILLVTGMLYVAILRGRLLGTGVRVDQTQFPELLAVVQRCSERLGLGMPEVFIRDDMYSPVVAIGFSPPYSLVISSYYLPHVHEDALTFLIGRELGHVAAGHTRISSFFMASGRDNPIVGAILGGWLRTTEYTADRVGLLCCGSLEAAIRAIVASNFHSFASRIDHAAFAAQQREIESEPLLRMGEWLGVYPYVTNRARALEVFARSEAFARLHESFAAGRFRATASPLEAPPAGRERRYYWRRAVAACIDFSLVTAILNLAVNAATPAVKEHVTTSGADSKIVEQFISNIGSTHIGIATLNFTLFIPILLYCAVLVALTGQTFGMIVMGLRVVGTSGERLSFGRAVWRYFVALVAAAFVAPLLISAFYGRPLHDWLSGTRVVSSMLRPAERRPVLGDGPAG